MQASCSRHSKIAEKKGLPQKIVENSEALEVMLKPLLLPCLNKGLLQLGNVQ